MGLFCSKTGKDERSPLAARLSPFGRFGRRSFHKGKERRVWREDSLLGACLDVVVGTLHLQDPAALQALPLDLAQLLLDHLVETGKLNDAAVLCLQGQHFYQLNLDAYPEPIRDFWVRFLVRQSLESVVLSRTAVR